MAEAVTPEISNSGTSDTKIPKRMPFSTFLSLYGIKIPTFLPQLIWKILLKNLKLKILKENVVLMNRIEQDITQTGWFLREGGISIPGFMCVKKIDWYYFWKFFDRYLPTISNKKVTKLTRKIIKRSILSNPQDK